MVNEDKLRPKSEMSSRSVSSTSLNSADAHDSLDDDSDFSSSSSDENEEENGGKDVEKGSIRKNQKEENGSSDSLDAYANNDDKDSLDDEFSD